ncbi:MAG: TCR/Tet family MFS transporter [Phycisphaerales bacterium]|nr:TCR/Tet family MFS transporter [Phycisphaerales bacterium]
MAITSSAVKTLRKPALKFIFLTLMLDVLGFGLLIPVAPRLIESLLHGGKGGTEAEAAPYVAALQSTFYAMAFLFAPLLGVLSDRVGRRPVILISLFGSGIDYLAMALSPTIAFLFVTRVINGLTGASFSVASAYVADVTPPEKRAAGFGMIGAAFGLGFVIGPVIGGVLGDINIRLPFYVAAGMTLVNWLYGYFVLPESLPREHRSPINLKRANPLGSLVYLKKYPLVLGMAIAMFLLNMAQFALHATWALSMQYRFEWTPKDIGMSLAAVGIGGAIVQGGLSGKIVPALGERRSLMFAIGVGILAYIGYGAATQGWMIYVVIALAAIGGIGFPAGQSLITKEVLPTEQGAIQGAMASLQSLAGIIGPLIGGITLAYFIKEPRPLPDSPIRLEGANFYVSALLSAIGLVAAAWAVRHRGEVRTTVAIENVGAQPAGVGETPIRK